MSGEIFGLIAELIEMSANDIGDELSGVVGLMGQLRAWANEDGQLCELGVCDGEANILQSVEAMLCEKFQVKSTGLSAAELISGPALTRRFDETIVTLYRLVTGQTKHYTDQWRLWGKTFTGAEFEQLIRSLNIVRKERFDHDQIMNGSDFYSSIMKMIKEEYPPEK